MNISCATQKKYPYASVVDVAAGIQSATIPSTSLELLAEVLRYHMNPQRIQQKDIRRALCLLAKLARQYYEYGFKYCKFLNQDPDQQDPEIASHVSGSSSYMPADAE